jgi:CrcB protein
MTIHHRASQMKDDRNAQSSNRLADGDGRRRLILEPYLLILIGSGLGGTARYWLSGQVARRVGETFPWGTFVVNVSGCFVIGFFDALSRIDGPVLAATTMRQFIMVGLCGGYTTFSSFSLQTLNLMHDGEWVRAGGNITASVLVCLISVWLGYASALSLRQLKWV